MAGRRGPRQDRAYADTNLFIVLFAGEEHPLHDATLSVFRRVADGQLRLILTSIVLAELVYVSERVLRWPRRTTGNRLAGLLDAQGLEIRERAVLERALALYASTRSLDFADAYLTATALEVGPARVASLDADLDRVPGIVRLAS